MFKYSFTGNQKVHFLSVFFHALAMEQPEIKALLKQLTRFTRKLGHYMATRILQTVYSHLLPLPVIALVDKDTCN